MPVIRAVLITAGRSAATACCVALAASGCTHRDAAVATRTEPTAAVAVDSLIVSVADVRGITDFEGLTPYPDGDVHQPVHHDSDAPAPCRSAYDQEAVFGAGWTQFRSVTYSGTTSPAPGGANKMLVVTQSAGGYPDEAAARAVFNRLVPLLNACSVLHVKYYDFVVDKPDNVTVELNFPSPNLSKIMYRMKSRVLTSVTVQGFPEAGRIAPTVLDAMTDRIQ